MQSGYGRIHKHEENLRNFILRVFLAFTQEACKVGLAGIWTVDRIREEADEFLRRFTIEAYYGYGHDSSGHRLPEMTSNWGHLKLEVEREFRKSSEWRKYEDELLATAEKIGKWSARQSKPKPTDLTDSRRAEVDAFIAKLAEDGRKINRKDIWIVAGYANATEFQRFQRGSARTTKSAAENFTRILKMKPDDFVRLLEKKSSK